MLDSIIVVLFCFLLAFLFYAVIPTIIIRIYGIGITKRAARTNGIALTFDDGPNSQYTMELLDLLKRYRVKASFFVVGRKVVQHPEIIERMHQEGHTIGIHHYRHISSWFLSPYHLRKELIMTENAIRSCTHTNVRFYRPPWGHFNIFTRLLSKRYKVIMWSHIFGDWKVEKCKYNLLEQLRKTAAAGRGSILVLHDCGETIGAEEEAPQYMLKSLETFLQESIKQGTLFFTLDDIDFMNEGGYFEYRNNITLH
ncbi:polysaccharide deacetylase family protein [Peribacillus sp. SCS-37]|uniref:polysaccharide deacetylase family protein n=1 Tax=Paraperibacillus esterisolvens TaxID=3115296 RepID=UPI0039067385